MFLSIKNKLTCLFFWWQKFLLFDQNKIFFLIKKNIFEKKRKQNCFWTKNLIYRRNHTIKERLNEENILDLDGTDDRDLTNYSNFLTKCCRTWVKLQQTTGKINVTISRFVKDTLCKKVGIWLLSFKQKSYPKNHTKLLVKTIL